jgi:hypothetical protein
MREFNTFEDIANWIKLYYPKFTNLTEQIVDRLLVEHEVGLLQSDGHAELVNMVLNGVDYSYEDVNHYLDEIYKGFNENIINEFIKERIRSCIIG